MNSSANMPLRRFIMRWLRACRKRTPVLTLTGFVRTPAIAKCGSHRRRNQCRTPGNRFCIIAFYVKSTATPCLKSGWKPGGNIRSGFKCLITVPRSSAIGNIRRIRSCRQESLFMPDGSSSNIQRRVNLLSLSPLSQNSGKNGFPTFNDPGFRLPPGRD